MENGCMCSNPIKRVSALAAAYTPGLFGADGKTGVVLQEVPNLTLCQVAVWPDSLVAVSARTAKAVGLETGPGPGRAATEGARVMLRIEPLKFWLIGVGALNLLPTEGAVLDLSHSRTHVRVTGPHAEILLNRHLPLELRSRSFPTGSVASTAFHDVGVTLWRSEAGFELFLPRSFALALWELLCQSAEQFGYEVV